MVFLPCMYILHLETQSTHIIHFRSKAKAAESSADEIHAAPLFSTPVKAAGRGKKATAAVLDRREAKKRVLLRYEASRMRVS